MPRCCDESQVHGGAFKVVPHEKQVQMLQELSALKGWNPGRDLQRLQQRVQQILSNWIDFYRSAMGNCERSPSPKPPSSSNCIRVVKVLKKYHFSLYLANSTLLKRTRGDPVHGHPCCSPSAHISQRPFCLLQGSNVTMASWWQLLHRGPDRPRSCTP